MDSPRGHLKLQHRVDRAGSTPVPSAGPLLDPCWTPCWTPIRTLPDPWLTPAWTLDVCCLRVHAWGFGVQRSLQGRGGVPRGPAAGTLWTPRPSESSTLWTPLVLTPPGRPAGCPATPRTGTPWSTAFWIGAIFLGVQFVAESPGLLH